MKTAHRYKTTDQVERAHVEEQDFQYLYQDGEGFHFMNPRKPTTRSPCLTI